MFYVIFIGDMIIQLRGNIFKFSAEIWGNYLGFTLLLVLFLTVFSPKTFALESRLTDRYVGDQSRPAIAGCTEGYVAVWQSYRQDSNSWGIFARRFDRNFSPVSSEFMVNTVIIGNQQYPDVAMEPDGGFTIVWHGPGVDETDIFARRYNSNGIAVDPEFILNQITASVQRNPAIAINSRGYAAVTWENIDPTLTPEKRSISVQILDPNYQTVRSEIMADIKANVCRNPDVAIRDDGRVVVCWLKKSGYYSVWRWFLDVDFNVPLIGQEISEWDFTSLTNLCIAMDQDGNYAIAWDGSDETYHIDDIFMSFYHWTGYRIRWPKIVNTTTTGAQRNPALSFYAPNKLMITWTGQGVDANNVDIFAQRFTYDANALFFETEGPEQIINTFRYSDKDLCVAAGTGVGNYVVAWESEPQDGSGCGVYGISGPAIKFGDITGDWVVNFSDYSEIVNQFNRTGDCFADLDGNGIVNFVDFGHMSKDWLEAKYDFQQADADGNGRCDLVDFAHIARWWNMTGINICDLNGDGICDNTDMAIIKLYWCASEL